MRTLSLVCLALSLIGCAGAPVGPNAPITIAPGLIAHPVPGVEAWRIEDVAPISANAMVILTADGTPILTDTPWTPAATEKLLAWIKAKFGRLPAVATIGHFHLDASGGLGALQAAGVPVIVSQATADLMAARGDYMREGLAKEYGAAFTGWTVAAATNPIAIEQRISRTIGGDEVEIIFPGHGHAPDNLAVWFPRQRVLFGGCLIKGGTSIGNLNDANLDTYAGAVRSLLALNPKVVVGGHGPRTDPGQLQTTIDLATEAAAKR